MSADGPRREERRALEMLGIARRAGHVATGAGSIRSACVRGAVELAVVARDASDNARSRVLPELGRRGVRIVECGTREGLGRAIGRGPTPVVAVTDRGLAEAFLRRLPSAPDAGGEPERGTGGSEPSGGDRRPG